MMFANQSQTPSSKYDTGSPKKRKHNKGCFSILLSTISVIFSICQKSKLVPKTVFDMTKGLKAGE